MDVDLALFCPDSIIINMQADPTDRVAARHQARIKRAHRCHQWQTRFRTYGHLIVALGCLIQMTAGNMYLCDGNVWTSVSVNLAFNLLASLTHMCQNRNIIRKGIKQSMCASIAMIMFDAVLIALNGWLWSAMFIQWCGSYREYEPTQQVMFYSNILSSVLILPSLFIIIILNASRLLLLITCCQYRSFHDVIVHSLQYHQVDPDHPDRPQVRERRPQMHE